MNCMKIPSVEELLAIEEGLDRFDAICMPALLSPALPDDKKTEENRIAVCDSKLWCAIEMKSGQIHLWPDSDSLWVKGLALMVKKHLEGLNPESIANESAYVSARLYEYGIIDEKRRRGMEAIELRVVKYISDAGSLVQ